MTASTRPLGNIKILDFTHHLSGPGCSLYLADLGAEVIKVEPPEGEQARFWGARRYGQDGQFSAVFLAYNRNKRGIVLDLKRPAAVQVALRLAASADVVLENFRPGVAARLGIGYEAIRAVKPDVVYCSVSGFGQTGPIAQKPAFDQLLQAYAGPASITGPPDGPPVRIGPPTIDTLTAAHAAIGVLAALHRRDQTGEGGWVDTSLYDAALQFMTQVLADSSGSGTIPKKFGAHMPQSAPYGFFRVADGDFFLGVSDDKLWERFCAASGLQELLDDPRFATNALRVRHCDELYERLEATWPTRSVAAWTELAEECRIPTAVVNNVGQVLADEQVRVREMIDDVGIDGVRCAAPPIRISGADTRARCQPPTLGRDTNDVLREAGFSQDEIDALWAERAIAPTAARKPNS